MQDYTTKSGNTYSLSTSMGEIIATNKSTGESFLCDEILKHGDENPITHDLGECMTYCKNMKLLL